MKAFEAITSLRINDDNWWFKNYFDRQYNTGSAYERFPHMENLDAGIGIHSYWDKAPGVMICHVQSQEVCVDSNDSSISYT